MILVQRLREAGLTLGHNYWFYTRTVEVADKAGVLACSDAAVINLRSNIYSAVSIILNETTMCEDMQALQQVVTGATGTLAIGTLDAGRGDVSRRSYCALR